MCNGGHETKVRHVRELAKGYGKCPAELSDERYHTRPCNEQACCKPNASTVLTCKSKRDVILLLDGSFSVGEEGFATTKKFAKLFVSAFKGQDVRVSLILFSGPRKYSQLTKCRTASTLTDTEKINDCGITLAQHFTHDMDATEKVIDGLKYPAASTFTSMALNTAMSEVSLSRPELKANETFVVTITDGVPISHLDTQNAAKALKDKGVRMIMVPVEGNGLDDDGIKLMYGMTSFPPEENFLKTDIHDLSNIATIDALVSDVCAEVEPCVHDGYLPLQ